MNKTPEHVARIQKFMENVIDEKSNNEDIVVHEAVEALGNLSQEHTISLLERFKDQTKTCEMIYQTTFLATSLIEWNKSTDFGKSEGVDMKARKFKTNDPAPPYKPGKYSVEEL